MNVRRVVTGHDDSGRSVFASDEQVAPVTLSQFPGSSFHRLWGADELPTFPDDGSPPAQPNYFPPVGGFRFGLFTLPPANTPLPPDFDLVAGLTEMEQKLPGMAAHLDPADPGMHTTETIDYEIVLSGEVVLELDDGAERVLQPGDTVIQNGTKHRWHNRGSEPAVLAVVLVGAHRLSS
jgi:mannose-6-phosphate isomerase-like protein (cupin superfamily)